MKYRDLILMAVLMVFTACGSSGDNTISDAKEELNSKSSFKHAVKTVTIYVHGFKQDGYNREAIYGDEYSSPFTTKLKAFTALPSLATYDKENFTNLVVGAEYYGNEAPAYYDATDIDDINKSTNGIPRYALVLAKFTKHVLAETGATRANIVSVSMGSLVTRYMIEKNLENLASDKKIEKWMTAEGVLRGNYALSKIDEIETEFIRNIINSFFNDSPETQQMKYPWIEANLTPNRDVMDSSYYDDILLGQISLTDSEKSGGVGLKYILPTHGGFQPNDGYQLVKDTYFDIVNVKIQVPSHSLVHTDHIGINESDSVFAAIATFLEAKKRVRITLIDAAIDDLHENIIATINEEAEIVFANQIFSEKAKEQFSMTTSIAKRSYDSGAVPIHYFSELEKEKVVNQILFDDFVLSSESKVQVELEAFEIDRNLKYNIKEVLAIRAKESLGGSTVSINLVNGIYPIVADDWSGHIKVEVVGM